jgi:hypothetical protein
MLRLRLSSTSMKLGARALGPARTHLPSIRHTERYAAPIITRNFSSKGNDGFRETLEKMNKKKEEGKEEGKEGTGEAKPEGEGAEGEAKGKEESGPDMGATFRKASDFATDAYVTVRENVSMAWADLTGASRQSTLRKTVLQADSFRRGGDAAAAEGEGEAEAAAYDGPTAMVVVKDRGSAWDQMKARLSSSPLIREMLKNTKKATAAAASTDVGKKAFETGRNMKDKVDVSQLLVSSCIMTLHCIALHYITLHCMHYIACCMLQTNPFPLLSSFCCTVCSMSFQHANIYLIYINYI